MILFYTMNKSWFLLQEENEHEVFQEQGEPDINAVFIEVL